ncbi:molybdopterin-binding protein [Corynebacterium liangguodongii]|uniref:Molybdopterin molybdenumtransferase n=1 Tax=Corynebacterium liangguodongii TaxID=2079535 RepID=A0A2S0WDU0_9CORY|nr:molybdopterin-binding protein [Corynebacterium liangguodongii]AWB83920.1 hypothetical protein C3E79_05030 [Corynebacterium liangguodongii]PWB99059.1 hypothetical protein DF219_08680 [Corynebacterium liangguodongii]
MLAAIIVAGGRSQRMSETAPTSAPPKPLLQHGGLPGQPRLVDASIAAADAAERIVVVGPPIDLPAHVARVREDPPFSGPAAAIAAGIRYLESFSPTRVLVLAADLIAPAGAVNALLAAARRHPGAQAWVGSHDGVDQPLASLLDFAAAREAFTDADVTGGSVRRALAPLETYRVEVDAADADTWEDASARRIGLPDGPATWVSARDRVAAAAASMIGEPVASAPLIGTVLAEDVVAPTDVPHYDSSAMDGFAIAGPSPWRLLAHPQAGAQGRNVHRAGGELRPGEALPILTGSLLPRGATAIVRSERCRVDSSSGSHCVVADADPAPGADIRRAGEELRRGEVLLRAGTRLGPRHAALLDACAVDRISAYPRVSVDVALTGNEVITAGVPAPGEVRDAFSRSFPALIEALGAKVGRLDRLADDPLDLSAWLERATADIVVVTGGTGHSGQDFARRAITERADHILAESVRCAPGHPTLVAARDRGDGRPQLFVGAPGNPLAAHVALHSFVSPAIAVASGREFPAAETCRAGEDIEPMTKRRVRLIPAWLNRSTDEAFVLTKTRSHMLSGYAAADALLVVGEGGAARHAPVCYLPL